MRQHITHLPMQWLRRFLIANLVLTWPMAQAAEEAPATTGLARIVLASSYHCEPVVLQAPPAAWNLPVHLPQAVNAGEVGAKLALDDNARTAIERNGFVVLPFGRATNLTDVYFVLREMGIPPFVTSDTLLHFYHVQFDDILKSVETNEFLPKLAVMSRALSQEAERQYGAATGDLQEAARRNLAFFTVALQLLGEAVPIPAAVDGEVRGELDRIGQQAGFAQSPLFHYLEDYSQYRPRGHYTRSEALGRYFKGMMWYGRMAFLLKGSNNPGPTGEALVSISEARVQTLQACLIALALDQLKADGTPIAALWNRIYGVTAYFVGLADDLTPYEYKQAIEKLFGPEFDVRVLLEEEPFFQLKKELALLRNPAIYGGTGNCVVPPNPTAADLDRVLVKTKGMRLMGQRFIPDSYLFQQLVCPVVGIFTGQGKPFTMEQTLGGPQRCFPRGLDVMAILGSDLALAILDRDGDTAYADYDVAYNRLRREFQSFDEAAWTKNLYWGWLYTLQSLLSPCGEQYPAFMRTEAWQGKQLATALASWTELRHDTILYAKQSYTPFVGLPPESVPGHVEPVPQFYRRLGALTSATRTGLSSLDVLTGRQEQRLRALETMLERLRGIAVAQLEHRPMSADDANFLKYFDLQLQALTEGIRDETDISTVLVADVHTDSNTGQVLEEGVGFAKLLVAAYELADGRRFLGAGPVLSYFEFKWPMADRMTDAQWSALLQSTNAPLAPSWTRAFGWPVVLPAEDSDGDQLPDAWEAKHWGNLATMNNAKADSDGDGACNAAELRSGTDPNDPESALRFRSIHRTGAEMRLEWRGAANRPCRVHYSDDLWHWYLLSTPVQGAPDGHATVTDSNATNSACRFYRLQAIPAGVGD